MASTSSSSDPPNFWKYDVFVSFRGTDTRKHFTDHLFAALDRKGIFHFRDDQRLERGRFISIELIKAIEESRFAIIVLSQNYASSSWCLDELAKIVECQKTKGQVVLPVFFDVDPSEVSQQTGSFEKYFAEYEKSFKDEADRVEKWRAALREVADLSGWVLGDRHQSTFIQEIVEELMSKLGHTFSSVIKGLVGIDSRLKEIELQLGMGLDDVRFIGICGVGGIGKTTLARVIYDQFSHQFEGSTFLENIEVYEKHDLSFLQEQLLSGSLHGRSMNIRDVDRRASTSMCRLAGQRVLIIIDNVDKLEQLKALAGERDWFGPGSRVIITTRDEQLLITHGVDEICKVRRLNGEEAHQLFSLKAFKDEPTKEYLELSKKIVNYIEGLPLAVVVLGSFLRGRRVNEWRSTLKKLKEALNRKTFDILKLCYDGLDETEKDIFLDVVCFFKGKNVDRVGEIFECFGFHPIIGIDVLIEKLFITIDDNKLWMHDLLEELGWSIVRQECPVEAGKRSRLWLYDDISHVLSENTGTEVVECIYLNSLEQKGICLNPEAFSKMYNLRLLKIHNVDAPKGLNFLPNKLRILKWHGYPLKSLPARFEPDKLVRLNMCHSRIEQLWKETVCSNALKQIKLSYSRNLFKTPDFTGVPNLESLILEGCTSLNEVHPSIGNLKHLVLLNLKDCTNLSSLPSCTFGLKSLKFLDLHGCQKFNELPESLGDLESLEELDASLTAIQHLPSSVVNLKNLNKLSLHGCNGQPSRPFNLTFFWSLLPRFGGNCVGFQLPSSFSGLTVLTELDLSNCSLSEGAIPRDLSHLSALKKLNLSRNDFVTLPSSIDQLSQLQSISLEHCEKLQELPQLPPSIECVCAYNCASLETILCPLGLNLSHSRDFLLNNCFKLAEHQGSEHVALTVLKCHLFSSMKVRLQVFFSQFFKWSESQPNGAVDIVLKDFIITIMKNLFQMDLSNPPLIVPKLMIYLPGSEIPGWFIYQGTNPSVTIELPSNWNNDYMLLGLVICAVVQVGKHPTISHADHTSEFIYTFSFSLLSDEDHFIFDTHRAFSTKTLAVSEHQWFLYLPFDEFFHRHNWRYIKASFETDGPAFEFKKYGIHFMYFKDVIELNQTMFEGMDFSQLESYNAQILQIMRQPGQSLVKELTQDALHHNHEDGPSGSGSFHA